MDEKDDSGFRASNNTVQETLLEEDAQTFAPTNMVDVPETSRMRSSNQISRIFSQLLGSKEVFVRDLINLEEKVVAFRHNGPSKVQVISDFDCTISAHKSLCGKYSCTTYKALLSYKEEVYNLTAKEEKLSEKYKHLEFSHSLTAEEKIPFMIEWWEEANKLIVQSGITKEDVRDSSIAGSIYVREGFIHFLRNCQIRDIPILVGSAGLGGKHLATTTIAILDIVYHRVKYEFNDNMSNINIISNFFEYNDQDIVIALTSPMIHSYNKYLISSIGKTYFIRNRSRVNILLFGDSIGDIDMINEIDWPINVIKIGFINYDNQDLFEQYLPVYDIIVKNPSSMKALSPLLNFILQ